jgi:hypothetical protein
MADPGNSNGKITWYQVLTPLLALAITIIMMISGFTLHSIDKKLDVLSDAISDHASRISRIEAIQLYDSGRISGIEDRERQVWFAKEKPKASPLVTQ